MSSKHPVVAVTGSASGGTSTSTVRVAMERVWRREALKPAVVEGDSFRRYDRAEMDRQLALARREGRTLSHFGPEANLFVRLEALFRDYGRSGTGTHRRYLGDPLQPRRRGQTRGTFSPWEAIPGDTDLLFYEGLHGGVKTAEVDIARHVDLLIGVAPTVNLEWIQKIHRDTREHGHSAEAVTDLILGRMHDYVHYITPQFSRSDINLQRVPTVDTSNPFIARDVPTLDESLVVIRFRNPAATGADFPFLLSMIHDAFMSRRNTVVVPGGKFALALELIFQPLIEAHIRRSRALRPTAQSSS